MREPGEVTQALDRLIGGDRSAFSDLLPLVYEELRALGRRHLRRERAGHTLQATALAHEAYLRLLGEGDLRWKDRAHFFSVAARAMRQILIEHARARGRKKRGGGWDRVRLESIDLVGDEPQIDVLALDLALTKLARRAPRQAHVVELLYFGGLTAKEAAEVLGVTARTVERDWRSARLWLLREIFDPTSAGAGPDPARRILRPGPPVSGVLPAAIGRYAIRREIGRGGMGVVYEAEDKTLARRIALKVLPTRLSGDSAWLRRFGAEARLLAAMAHPNVASVYTLEESDGLHFLTMELFGGAPLSERLSAGPLPLEAALRICRQVANALEAVHRKGVAHCDLKPLNILVSPEETVKVIDFGLARPWARGRIRAGKSRGTIASGTGTPGYMPPEQIVDGDVDHRADIWAFGCLLYECLTGLPAFPGNDAPARIDATLNDEPRWARLPGAASDRLRDILARCLEKSVDARLDDIAVARRAIEEDLARLAAPHRPADDEALPQNLPRWPNVFVGREDETEALRRLLTRSRLVTMTGPGGCGKTRLAANVGRRLLRGHRDGVWFVDLSTSSDAEQAIQTAAGVLQVTIDPGRAPVESLLEGVSERCALLILDNCEHLLEACRTLADRLLESGAGIRILATSREPLGSGKETVFALTPLRPPEAGISWGAGELAEVESVRLFLARAARSDPTFALTDANAAAVAEICRRLDGIPLAIELAAARLPALPPAAIVEGLHDRLDSHAGEPSALPRRQQTLESLIGWSYALLSPKEQMLFRRLSVFVGGFTLHATEAVCRGDGLESWELSDLLARLGEKSLVEPDVGARPVTDKARFRVLDTIREFAGKKLRATGEASALSARHAAYFAALAEEASPHLKGAGQLKWLATLDADHDNLRRALDAFGAPDADPEAGLRFVCALERYWTTRGYAAEAQRYLDAMLSRSGAATSARGHALNAAANRSLSAGDPEKADRLYDEALRIGREIGDAAVVARSVHNKGGVALSAGRFAEARAWFQECLAMDRGRGDRFGEGTVLANLGLVAEREGDLAEARGLYGASLGIFQELGDRKMMATVLNNLGGLAVNRGDYAAARSHLEASLEIHREMQDRWSIANATNNLGAVVEHEGDLAAAAHLYRESLRLHHEVGDRGGVCAMIAQLGRLAAVSGSPRRAATLLAAAEALRARIQAPLPPLHRRLDDEAVSTAEAALGREAFAAHWRAGSVLSTDAAVAMALRDDPAESGA